MKVVHFPENCSYFFFKILFFFFFGSKSLSNWVRSVRSTWAIHDQNLHLTLRFMVERPKLIQYQLDTQVIRLIVRATREHQELNYRILLAPHMNSISCGKNSLLIWRYHYSQYRKLHSLLQQLLIRSLVLLKRWNHVNIYLYINNYTRL